MIVTEEKNNELQLWKNLKVTDPFFHR